MEYYPAGYAKGITNSKTVTEEGEYVLDAAQNNPDVPGSLRQDLNNLLRQFVFKSGDSIALNDSIWTVGTLTFSNTIIFIDLPMPVITSATPKIKLTYIKVRQNNDYLISESNDAILNSINATCLFIPYYGFRIGLEKTSGFGGINNDVVAVEMSYTITFE